MKKEGAVILSVVIIGAAIFFLLRRKPVVAKNFTISQVEWDAPMPFTPNSRHAFNFTAQNLDSKPCYFKVELYWLYGGALTWGDWESSLQPNSGFICSGILDMPNEPGTYNMTVKLYIDEVYIDEFVISEVEVK